MKRYEPMSIRQIVDLVLDSSKGRNEMYEHRAASLWTDVMGQGISRHTLRRYVSKGVLHVHLDSASLKNELFYQRPAIVRAINDLLGREILTDIVFH